MENLKIGNESLPSVLQDPFKKSKITKVYVSYSENIFTAGKWSARGSVEFVNNNTKGKQEFEGKTFDEVALKIKQFINQLD